MHFSSEFYGTTSRAAFRAEEKRIRSFHSVYNHEVQRDGFCAKSCKSLNMIDSDFDDYGQVSLLSWNMLRQYFPPQVRRPNAAHSIRTKLDEQSSQNDSLQLDFDINLRKATIKEVQELKSKLRAAIKKQHTARNVTLRDKISFVIGTTLATCVPFSLPTSQ